MIYLPKLSRVFFQDYLLQNEIGQHYKRNSPLLQKQKYPKATTKKNINL
jgi:hypothetical protein